MILLDSRKSSGVVEGGSVGHKGIKKHFFLRILALLKKICNS